MTLEIDTGSGRIDIDVPDARTVRTERGYVETELGDGTGRGRIDTGSGSVRLVMR